MQIHIGNNHSNPWTHKLRTSALVNSQTFERFDFEFVPENNVGGARSSRSEYLADSIAHGHPE
jgi:hypothetical protein